MDVDYCLAREQVEQALARASTAPGARASHNQSADRYRRLIDEHRGRAARPAGAGFCAV
jgi:hypothetical protein